MQVFFLQDVSAYVWSGLLMVILSYTDHHLVSLLFRLVLAKLELSSEARMLIIVFAIGQIWRR